MRMQTSLWEMKLKRDLDDETNFRIKP